MFSIKAWIQRPILQVVALLERSEEYTNLMRVRHSTWRLEILHGAHTFNCVLTEFRNEFCLMHASLVYSKNNKTNQFLCSLLWNFFFGWLL